MEEKDKAGYKEVLKASSIFGGVQVFTILIAVIKSKIVAVWLGSTGYGLMSLYTTATNLIYALTNLGLSSSTVREVSRSYEGDNKEVFSTIIYAIKRWIIATGLAGTFITILLAPLLSKWLFESNEYILSFMLLSIIVLLRGINEGYNAILQGTRKLKYLAINNIYGSLIGLLFALPIYYFWREKGIVPVMILSAIFSALVTLIYTRRIEVIKVTPSNKEIFQRGVGTAKLGLAMSVTMISVYFVEFLVKSFITKTGGVDDVGLYQAGWVINSSYLGLVFTAMAKDYYPRISASCENARLMTKQVNQQAEIALLILAPMISGMLVFLPLFVRIIYSHQFLAIVPMTQWLLVGSMVKAGSWAMSFVFLAKAHSKLFLINELSISVIAFSLYILGYYWLGLKGIGFAFFLIYSIYFVWIGIISYKKYGFYYLKSFWQVFIRTMTLILGILILINIDTVSTKGMAILTLILCVAYSIYEINKRIDILNTFIEKIKK